MNPHTHLTPPTTTSTMESLSSVSTSIVLPPQTPFHHHHNHRRRRIHLRSSSVSASCLHPDHLRRRLYLRSSFLSPISNPRLKPCGSRIDVEALPTVAVTEEDDCAICLTEYGLSGDATELPCKHRFHSDCVVKWLGIHGSCPVCRYEMPVDEEAEKRRRDSGVGWQVVITVSSGGGPVGEVGRFGSGLEERNGQWVVDMDIDVHDVGSSANWDQHSSSSAQCLHGGVWGLFTQIEWWSVGLPIFVTCVIAVVVCC